MSTIAAPFKEALDLFPDSLSKLKNMDRPYIGYFCTYTPIELIYAAGFMPVRIFGGAGQVDQAYNLAPQFICPPVLRSLEMALSGKYDFLKGVIQGYTCDVVCGMVNVWRDNFPRDLYHTLPIPYNDNPAGIAFFRSAIMELIEKMEGIGGRFTSDALAESLDLYDTIRQHILDLYSLRYEGRLPLSASAFYDIIRAGFIIPPLQYLDMLQNLENELKDMPASGNEGVPVLVSGSFIEDPDVFRVLESVGARVVADDLCTGSRAFHMPDAAGNDSIERLMYRYLQRLPCPSRSRAQERLPFLIDLIHESNAKGVLFILQKFCTPHLADEPVLRDALSREGIKSMVVELEATGVQEGQLSTRLQGFVEMLQKK